MCFCAQYKCIVLCVVHHNAVSAITEILMLFCIIYFQIIT